MEYLPKLDGVRTIAVFMVIFSHYFDFGENAGFGYLGVNLFFFLSGFLITSLMVRDKNTIEVGRLTTGLALKNFYIRRALRIFPLYYFVIAMLFLLGDVRTGTHVRQDIGFYGLYLVNLKYFLTQSWDGIASHFWSLSVEEQYYVFWPFIFFISPKKWIGAVVVLVGVTSFSYKCFLMQQSDSIFNHLLLATCAYKFCLGAMLTLSSLWKEDERLRGWGRWVLIGFSVISYALTLIFRSAWGWLIQDLAGYGMFIFLLINVKYLYKGFWHRFLSNPFVRHLGVISYGLYVYHLIVPWLLSNLFSRMGLAVWVYKMHLYYPLCIVGTIAVSHFSYFYFEKHFLKLKSRFNSESRKNEKQVLV